MTIDAKTALKIAHLSRIKLDEAEAPQVAADLSTIMNWIEQLNAVDVAGIEPLASVNDANLRERPDVVTDGGKPQDVLANAPAKTADFFTVPKVVE